MTQHFNVYDTIVRIRPRPAMYLGEHSLIRLDAFLDGCFHLAYQFGIPFDAQPTFGGFHDWVARRFGWRESTAGWCNIILQVSGGDDRRALDAFFALIEEYRQEMTPAEGSWAVHRQDDNGNRFVVQTGLGREEADQLVAEFEARGHKQVYWAEPEQG